MMKRLVVFCLVVCLALPLTAQSNTQSASNQQDQRTTLGGRPAAERIQREVRHELVMLPYYSVFDNLNYQVQGDTVILSGQVSRPTLKTDSERVVKNIEGVEKVINNIEVLPNSPSDDRIRRAVAQAIYGDASLSRYAWGSVPPIHIVVKNGRVALEGVVDKEADKNIAGIRAREVSSVFEVQNNLRVIPSDQQK